MAKEGKSAFGSICEKAWKTAEEWGNHLLIDELPTPLVDLAKSYSVTRIERAPIFSSAGLKHAGLKHSRDAFCIVINTETSGINETEETEISLTEESLRKLPDKVRFSIAHEIAHLVILKESGKKPSDPFFKRNLHKLEPVCNYMARALLIPKRRLIQEIGDKLFDAVHIHQLIERFGVWPGVFVWRLQMDDLLDSFSGRDGVLGYAEENRGGVTVPAARVWGGKGSWPYSDTKVKDPRDLIVGPQNRNIKGVRINLDLEDFLRNSQEDVIESSIPWHASQRVPCILSVARIRLKPLKAVFAIKVTGEISSGEKRIP